MLIVAPDPLTSLVSSPLTADLIRFSFKMVGLRHACVMRDSTSQAGSQNLFEMVCRGGVL